MFDVYDIVADKWQQLQHTLNIIVFIFKTKFNLLAA